ncbi:MAG: helix-turn-helix domain-containing protein [Alphaproteobacteria bacterium]|nr:helix-turn-helix domain-containing protein [Alphaproteobacteria bacterium]
MSRRPAGDGVDVHVGKRVRERRVQLGMSQKNLAAAVGVSFQQIQKNERGTNRIGASRMLELSRALDVPVSFFFDDMPPQPPVPSAVSTAPEAGAGMEIAPDVMASRETQELVEVYYAIPDQRARKRLLTFIRSIPSTVKGR